MSANTASSASLAECKKTLYDAVAPLDFGRVSLDDEAKQAEIDALIADLESRNPTDNPADHPLRKARWRLVYTNSPIVLGIIFFLLFTPISLIMKLIGRDELRLKFKQRPSHWKPRDTETSQPGAFKNQF